MSKSLSRTFKNAAYAHVAEVGKALSSPARLEILELLAQAPRTVEVLAGEVDQSVANTSHHLQALKRAQLVTAERDGLHVWPCGQARSVPRSWRVLGASVS